MTRTLILFVLALLFGIPISAQNNESLKKAEKINRYLAELEAAGFSGSNLVELNGKVVVSKGYGYRNLERKEKNTTNTIFDIGSLTKQFTATAILKLAMQGKLKTSDNLTKYFQSVPEDKSVITIHDLLRHQSGLQSTVGKDYDLVTESAFLDTVMKSRLKFKPGTDFSYSNIGYSLLAIIIEKVYAYGWDIHKTDRNTLMVWHNGTNHIFYSDFMQFTDENTTLIMMSNKSNDDFNELNFTLAKIIFEKDYEPVIPKPQ